MAKDNKREKILNALEQLLPGKRFHEITLDEVARAAQVGKGTIYLYFKDKDALFAEMVCYRLEKLQQQMEQLANCDVAVLPDRIFELVGGFIRHHRNWFGAIGDYASHMARMSDEQHQKVKLQGRAVLDTLAAVMKNSMPQWDDKTAAFNARVLLWLTDGYVRSEMTGEDALPPAEMLLEFYRRGAGL